MTPTLRTARLTLSPPRPDDRGAIATLVGDLEVARWLAVVPHPYTPEHADAFVAVAALDPLCFAVRLAPDAPLVGMVGVATGEGDWELGYWLGRPWWGRGIATEAVRAVVARAAAVEVRPPLVSGYFDGNERSAAVLAKAGFVATGRSRVWCVARAAEVDRTDMVYGPDRAAA